LWTLCVPLILTFSQAGRCILVLGATSLTVLGQFLVCAPLWGLILWSSLTTVASDIDLCDQLSRVKDDSYGRFGKEADPWGFNTAVAIKITGRHIINIWRAMRGELNLLGYTMENVVFHLLHQRSVSDFLWFDVLTNHWFTLIEFPITRSRFWRPGIRVDQRCCSGKFLAILCERCN
jgi:hypothetical protein